MKLGKILGSFALAGILASGAAQIANAQEYDAKAIADLFYKANGDSKNPKKKINHTKGFCASGEFIPAKNISKKVSVPLLSESSIPAQVRYSLGGGNPNASDKSKIKGMAIKLQGQNDSWEMAMTNTQINFAKNSKEFYEWFAMNLPKSTLDAAKLKAEVDSYRNFLAYLKTFGITPSYANTPFYSDHTFKFKQGNKDVFARWKFVPKAGEKYLSDEELKALGDNFLRKDFQDKLTSGAVDYDMYLIYANKKDVVDDTTALWSGKHKEEFVGTLKVTSENGLACNGDVFMPGILPSGVGAPIDPLFELRNAVYAITFSRRQ